MEREEDEEVEEEKQKEEEIEEPEDEVEEEEEEGVAVCPSIPPIHPPGGPKHWSPLWPRDSLSFSQWGQCSCCCCGSCC